MNIATPVRLPQGKADFSREADTSRHTQMNSPILRVVDLKKTFDEFTALDSVNLTVDDGEFLAIVGPSGSGKTTLIRLLVGMEEQTSGEIWLRDRRIDNVPANKRPTCMVFQSLALFPHRSVGQNIEFPLKIRGVDPAERRARALELLDLVRLPQHYYDKRIQQCSGGERQRVALARALVRRRPILLLDEPFAALDPAMRADMAKLIAELRAETKSTLLFITHQPEDIRRLADRVMFLESGAIVLDEPSGDFLSRRDPPAVAKFLGHAAI